MEETNLESWLMALRGAAPGAPSPLPAGEVRAWVCPRPLPPWLRAEAFRYLTLFDHEALSRVSNAAAREERTQARALLRALLALHHGSAVAALPFNEREHGKPFLRGGPAGLEFSVSHSRGAVAVALAEGIDVGIDVEVAKPIAGRVERLAPRVLDEASLGRFLALPASDLAARDAFFYRQWVLRESVLKALGSGLTVDPRGLVPLDDAASKGSKGSKGSKEPIPVSVGGETFLATFTMLDGVPVALASRTGRHVFSAIRGDSESNSRQPPKARRN